MEPTILVDNGQRESKRTCNFHNDTHEQQQYNFSLINNVVCNNKIYFTSQHKT